MQPSLSSLLSHEKTTQEKQKSARRLENSAVLVENSKRLADFRPKQCSDFMLKSSYREHLPHHNKAIPRLTAHTKREGTS